MEPQKLISDEKLFGEIQTFVEWHPWKNHLYYFAHEHRMTFYHEKKNDEVHCGGCSEPIDHALYGCTKTECQSQIFFHRACAELPGEINHPSHKSHPLTLVQDPSRNPPLVPAPEISKGKCSGCNLPIFRAATYSCKDESCKDAAIHFHKSCLELPAKIAYPKHPSHLLLLNHASAGSSSTFYCTICLEDHTGLNYQCERCDYNCGIRCLVKAATIAAAACSSSRSDGPTQGHVLTFLREQPSDCLGDDCLVCSERLSSQAILCCKECDFSLHIHCVLPFTMSVLPPTFQSKKLHRHPLTLTNYSGEYYKSAFLQDCDVCDEFINPTSSFYFCNGCDFAVDLTCALRQMEMSFAHKLGNLMLSTSPVVIRNPSLTVSEIVESITKDDQEKFDEIVVSIMEDDQKRKLNDVVEAAKTEKDGAGRKLLEEQQDDRGSSPRNEPLAQGMEIFESKRPDPKSGEIAESITEEEDDQDRKLNDAAKAATSREKDGAARKILLKDQKDDSGSSSRMEPLVHIMEIFESKRRDTRFGLTYYDTRSQVTYVNEYMISKNLEPVLKALLSKYGDFSAHSPMSPHGKTFIFVILCAAIYSICNTKDAEINEFQLFTCWDCFKIAEHAGFEIQFAFDRLRKAMLGYFGLGTDPALAELDKDTAIELRQEVDALEHKCALLDIEMAELKAEMEALQEKRALRMTTLLSNSMREIPSDTIEIVGPNKVLNSWDDDEQYWDDANETSDDDTSSSEKQEDDIREECLRETSDDDTSSEKDDTSNLMKDCLSETSELETQTKLSDPREEGQKNGTLKLVRYSKAMPTSDWQKNLTNKIEAFIEKKDDTVFLVQKEDSHVFCSGWEDETSCEELQPKIKCDFHNKHTLSLFRGVKGKTTLNKSSNKKVKDEALCIACQLPISDAARDKSYHCSRCEISLHNLCINLPKVITKHPLHPVHPLSLNMDSEILGKITCNACGEKFRGSGYGCQRCNFYLEVQCLFLESEPTIQSHSHGILLLLEEKRPRNSPHCCFACGKKIADPPFLRCAPCNISLHRQCPLSSTIARTFHDHPLALTPWYFGDADKPDCKICKKEMSAMDPTYYCQECGYVAHIDCATSNATSIVEQGSRSIRK